MTSLRDIVLAGGPIVLLLIVLSVLSIALIAARLLALRGIEAAPAARRRALEAWKAGDRHAARAALDPHRPVDRMLLAAMDGLEHKRPRAALDAELEWRGNAEMADLGKHLRALELIATISPLLGLLGTVLGMIRAFQELALAQGAANAALLASGIWQALLTTAAGLLVAIPAAVAATLLAARVERAGQGMETAIGQLYAAEDGRGGTS